MNADELKVLTPALHHAIFPDNGWWRPTEDCRGCPFASKTDRHPGSDPEIDFVMCNLRKKRLWMDQPECEEKDWQKKAQEELETIAAHLPKLERVGPVVLGKRLPMPG